MSHGPFPAEWALWVPLLLAVLGLGLAVFGVVQQRALAGIAALLLATVTAGLGVVGQLRAEAEIETFIASGGSDGTRARGERSRRYRYPHAQGIARKSALAALLPLLLGAAVALRKPGTRVLSLGFVALALLAWAAAWKISHRPLPVDRYALAEDDDLAWEIAIDLDEVARGGREDCVLLDATLLLRHEPLPPELQSALKLAAERCLSLTLAEMNFERHKPKETELREWLRHSVLVRDWAPDAGGL